VCFDTFLPKTMSRRNTTTSQLILVIPPLPSNSLYFHRSAFSNFQDSFSSGYHIVTNSNNNLLIDHSYTSRTFIYLLNRSFRSLLIIFEIVNQPSTIVEKSRSNWLSHSLFFSLYRLLNHSHHEKWICHNDRLGLWR